MVVKDLSCEENNGSFEQFCFSFKTQDILFF